MVLYIEYIKTLYCNCYKDIKIRYKHFYNKNFYFLTTFNPSYPLNPSLSSQFIIVLYEIIIYVFRLYNSFKGIIDYAISYPVYKYIVELVLTLLSLFYKYIHKKYLNN